MQALVLEIYCTYYGGGTRSARVIYGYREKFVNDLMSRHFLRVQQQQCQPVPLMVSRNWRTLYYMN